MSDDFFKKYAEELEKKEKERNQNRSTQFVPGDFEDVRWLGLNSGSMKVVRLIGGTLSPDFVMGEVKKGDPVEFIFAEVKDDKGKKMQLRLPIDDASSNNRHIIHRIISRVMEVDWVDKKKVFPVKIKHPEIFNIVEKGNFSEKDIQFKFARGWKGQRIAVFNCIDRSDMEWHRENKKTKLLSKNVNVTVDDNGVEIEWPTVGVPSYGFVSELFSIAKYSGSWENYDLGIERTGKMEKPMNIVNLTRFKQKDFLDDFVDRVNPEIISTNDGLTDEEKSWKLYDIAELYKPTPYGKILNRLGNQIKKIDAALNTNYYDELKQLADEETAANDSKKIQEAQEKKVETNVEISSSILEEETPEVEKATIERSPEKISRTPVQNGDNRSEYLKGWDNLSDEHKSMIEDVVVENGKLVSVNYSPAAGNLAVCPTDSGGCGFESPMAFPLCPVCGVNYE